MNFLLVFLILFMNSLSYCCGSEIRANGSSHFNLSLYLLQKSAGLSWSFVDDFILIDNLEDGEFERRISFNGIAGKETSIQKYGRKSLTLWQVSNGYSLIQLIYSDADQLIDCELIRQKHLIHDFLSRFYEEVDTARQRNFTAPAWIAQRKSLISNHEFRRYVEDDIIPDEFYETNDIIPVNDAFGMRNLSYKPVRGWTDISDDMKYWLNINELKIKCTKRHQEIKQTLRKMNSNGSVIKPNVPEHFHRKRRALSDWLIAPNTKWCGRGHNASKYSQLGGASRADKCCRKHDHCRLHIPGLTTKWHLFNYRPFTLSHCKCDMRFRTCLKIADSPDANMVGKLFFNIVQTKCFVLKPEKICKRRSWWGRCEERILRKTAHMRNNRQF